MKPLAPFSLLLGCLLSIAVYSPVSLAAPATSNAAPNTQNGDAVQQLYERAKWFVGRGRADLAQETLDKLFSITTTHPAALTLQAQLYMQQNQSVKAQTMLDRIKSLQPNSVDVLRVESLIRSEGSDKGELRHARNLVKEARVLREKASQLRDQGREKEADAKTNEKNARYQQAIAIFEKLFPNGLPSDDLALEYWDMVSNTPNGWQSARDGLAQLVSEHPNNQRFRLALAEHELAHPPLVRKNLQAIIDASRDPEFGRPARNVWRRVMMRLDDQPSSLPLLEEYMASEPSDSGVRVKIEAIQQAQIKHELLLADPAYRAQTQGLDLLEKNDLEAAEPLLLQAMEARPNDDSAVGGMGLLRLRQGRHAEAREHFKRAYQLSSDNKKKWSELGNVAEFWGLLSEVRAARQAGDFALAKNKANSALRLKRNDPNALAALGDVEADSGATDAAIGYYRRALSVDPLNGSALEGLISLYRRQGMTQAQRFASTLTPAQREVIAGTLSNMEMANIRAQSNDADELLAALDHIPAERRSAAVWRTWSDEVADLAETLAASDKKEDANRLLTDAGALAENNEDANLAFAIAWAKLGKFEEADKLFAQVKAAASPTSTRWNLSHAEYLSIKHAPELQAELTALNAQADSLLPEEQLRLRDLNSAYVLDTASAHLRAKRYADAHQTLNQGLTNEPFSLPFLLLDGEVFLAEKNPRQASSVYTAALGLDPYEPEARHGWVESAAADSRRAQALLQLDQWAAHVDAENQPNQQQLVDLYMLIGEKERARKLVQALLLKYPTDTYVLKQAMQVAVQQRQKDDQINYLRQSIAISRGEIPANEDDRDEAATDEQGRSQMGFNRLGSAKKIHRDWQEKKLAALIDQRGRWLSSAMDFRNTSGTSGISQYNAIEMPIEYRRPWHPSDEVFFRTDLVSIDAGTVDAASKGLGSMELCQPNCNAAPLAQSALGAGFTAGYLRGAFHADVGVTPVNFLVSNWVGGIGTKGDVGTVSVSVDASRRPMTGSLLSYAGTRDPNTGLVWGGMVASGVRLGLGFGNSEKYTLSTSLDVHKLSGQNVATNDRARLMAFYSWYFVNEENRRFALGLAGMYWRHSHNFGEYMFGQGGYFSPADYRSASINLGYGERLPRLSYYVRGGFSYSQSITDATNYYPTRPDLQLQSGQVVSASTGSGVGYSVQGSCEYQVSQPLFVGGFVSIDRSVGYVPNRAVVYLRYALDQPASQPVNFPPLPVDPSSQF